MTKIALYYLWFSPPSQVNCICNIVTVCLYKCKEQTELQALGGVLLPLDPQHVLQTVDQPRQLAGSGATLEDLDQSEDQD